MNVTGYDLIRFICDWINRRRFVFDDICKFSVCEMILLCPDFAHIRGHIGIANLYWAHIQMEGFLGLTTQLHGVDKFNSTLRNLLSADANDPSGHLPVRGNRFHWIDYMAIRQEPAVKDFHLVNREHLMHIIADIGVVAFSVDKKWALTKSPWCVFEAYAAKIGNCRTLCCQDFTPSRSVMLSLLRETRAGNVSDHMWHGRIDLAKTESWDVIVKWYVFHAVDMSPGGFAELNSFFEQALISSCRVE